MVVVAENGQIRSFDEVHHPIRLDGDCGHIDSGPGHLETNLEDKLPSLPGVCMLPGETRENRGKSVIVSMH